MRTFFRLLLATFALLIVTACVGASTARADYDVDVTGATLNVSSAFAAGTTTFTATASPATIDVADIDTALGLGNVIINTGTGGAEDGDIDLGAVFTVANSGDLTIVPGATGRALVRAVTMSGTFVVQGLSTLGIPGSNETLSAGSIGLQGAVTIAPPAPETYSVTASGNVSFGSTVDSSGGGAAGFEVTSTSGTIAFNGAVGGTQPLDNVLLTATAGGTDIDGGTFTADSNITTDDPVRIGADTVIEAASAVQLSGGIDGASALTINTPSATGNLVLGNGVGGHVGATMPPTSLTWNGGLNSTLDLRADVTTTGAQDYSGGDMVIVDGTSTLDTGAGADAVTLPAVSVPGVPTGSESLIVNSGGVTTFGAGLNDLDITTNAGGTTTFTSDNPSAAGDLLIGDTLDVPLLNDPQIVAGTTLDIDDVTGATNLELLATTSIDLRGTIDPLTSLTINDLVATGLQQVRLHGATITADDATVNAAGIELASGTTSITASLALENLEFYAPIEGRTGFPGTTSLVGSGPGSFLIDGSIGATVTLDDLTLPAVEFKADPTDIGATGDVTFGVVDANEGTTSIDTTGVVSIAGLVQGASTFNVDAPTSTFAGTRTGTGPVNLTSGSTAWNVTSQTGDGTVGLNNSAIVVWSAGAPAQPVTLNGGGAIRGSGSIGVLGATGTGGTIDPGSGDTAATFATGNLTGSNLVTYRVDNGASATDRLDVIGSISWSTATLVIDTGLAAPLDVARTIISNDGVDGFLGTFSGLGEGAIITAGDGSLHRLSYVGGDGNDVTLTRQAFPTTITLTQSSATSTAGGTVTLTATLSGAGGTRTGNVSFRDGATVLGTATINGSGVATFATPALTAGAHSFDAVYAGAGVFAGATSTALAHTTTAVTTPPPADPDPTGPAPLRAPSPVLTDRCIIGNDALPTISLLVSRRARVTYTLERRTRPVVTSNRLACDRAHPSLPSGTVRRFARVATWARTHRGGRVRMPLESIVRSGLAPGKYRVRIVLRAEGSPVRRGTVAFTVRR
jgi:hypothetical protein